MQQISKAIRPWRIVPPFIPGDRVLYLEEPWRGTWLVTACEPHPRGGFMLMLRSAAATGIDMAHRYVLAPEDWEEPPPRPLFGAGILTQDHTAAQLASDAERLAYYRRYVAWGRVHLLPLGHHDHVRGFERLIALLEMAQVPAEAAQ